MAEARIDPMSSSSSAAAAGSDSAAGWSQIEISMQSLPDSSLQPVNGFVFSLFSFIVLHCIFAFKFPAGRLYGWYSSKNTSPTL